VRQKFTTGGQKFTTKTTISGSLKRSNFDGGDIIPVKLALVVDFTFYLGMADLGTGLALDNGNFNRRPRPPQA
jgi:hypothetical protein